MNLTNKESLMLQSLATCQFLSELDNNLFLESAFYERMKFGNPQSKMIMTQSGLGNPATMLMMLYGLLVIPYELMKEDIESLDGLVRNLAEGAPALGNSIVYLVEAVKNCNVEFINEDDKGYVLFNNSLRIESSKVGLLMNQLQILAMMYFNRKMSNDKTVS